MRSTMAIGARRRRRGVARCINLGGQGHAYNRRHRQRDARSPQPPT
jgi:hypothetical protein